MFGEVRGPRNHWRSMDFQDPSFRRSQKTSPCKFSQALLGRKEAAKNSVSMNMRSLLGGAVFIGFGILTSCQKSKVEREITDDQSYLKTAEEASGVLMKALGGQLKAAMEAGGPVAAVQVCQQVAQPITKATSKDYEGYAVTRTALRVRNETNAPTAKDREVMERWEKNFNADQGWPESELVRDDQGGVVVYRPILTQDLCLKCHGDPATFGEDLKRLLAEHYPTDEAVGFVEGSLRGVFKVEFSSEK